MPHGPPGVRTRSLRHRVTMRREPLVKAASFVLVLSGAERPSRVTATAGIAAQHRRRGQYQRAGQLGRRAARRVSSRSWLCLCGSRALEGGLAAVASGDHRKAGGPEDLVRWSMDLQAYSTPSSITTRTSGLPQITAGLSSARWRRSRHRSGPPSNDHPADAGDPEVMR